MGFGDRMYNGWWGRWSSRDSACCPGVWKKNSDETCEETWFSGEFTKRCSCKNCGETLCSRSPYKICRLLEKKLSSSCLEKVPFFLTFILIINACISCWIFCNHSFCFITEMWRYRLKRNGWWREIQAMIQKYCQASSQPCMDDTKKPQAHQHILVLTTQEPMLAFASG